MQMKRTFKLNGEVSIEANDMLVAYCKKHERSKGFLLEKMIRKFCVEVEAAPAAKTELAVAKDEKPKAPVKRFIPPGVLEVQTYMLEKGVHISKNSKDEAEKFCDHFESNGWKVGGKTKMVSWKAAVRNFMKNGSVKPKAKGRTSGNLSACEDFING
jgi:hypothetical protein